MFLRYYFIPTLSIYVYSLFIFCRITALFSNYFGEFNIYSAMVGKCCVPGCTSGYSTGNRKAVFSFPMKNDELCVKWIRFINRANFFPGKHTKICILHFKPEFIQQNEQRPRLRWSLNPIPSIYPSSVCKSLQATQSFCRKPPAKRIYQPDQIHLNPATCKLSSLHDVKSAVAKSNVFKNFQVIERNNTLILFNLNFNSENIPCIGESIVISESLHVKITYGGKPFPLPEWLRKASGCKLSSLSMLENIVPYCRNAADVQLRGVKVIEELMSLVNYSPAGRPKYSAEVLRFALLLRYTSNSAYKLMRSVMPLPSYSLLTSLKSGKIKHLKALVRFRDQGEIDNDVVLLIDEMHLQESVEYDGRDSVGADEHGELYTGILCFMVVSLKKSTPFILLSIPVIRLNSDIVLTGIETCATLLFQHNFSLLAIITDNHASNVSAFNKLVTKYRVDKRNYVIEIPSCSGSFMSHIYLLYDTVHLLKNIRNNFARSGGFVIPAGTFLVDDQQFDVSPGNLHWNKFEELYNCDSKLISHLKKAPKLTYSAIHFGNNKQSVPLALAIFHDTTIAAMRSYFPEPDNDCMHSFLHLINCWWLVLNAKERFHPNKVGSALEKGTTKIGFLRDMANWISLWLESGRSCLSKQTALALIQTNNAIADLCDFLFDHGYDFILTGRLQTDPLERRYSQYRQMSGGRFLISLQDVLRSENIIKIKTYLQHSIPLSSINEDSQNENNYNDFTEDISEIPPVAIDSDSFDVVVYVSGYIYHCLLNKPPVCSCKSCGNALQICKVDSKYLHLLNRGGLSVPGVALTDYVASGFAILNVVEKTIHQYQQFSSSKLAEIALQHHLHDTLGCSDHANKVMQMINRMIVNIFFSNQSTELSNKRRKRSIEEFKTRQRKKLRGIGVIGMQCDDDKDDS